MQSCVLRHESYLLNKGWVVISLWLTCCSGIFTLLGLLVCSVFAEFLARSKKSCIAELCWASAVLQMSSGYYL